MAQWKLTDVSEEQVAALMSELQISRSVARVLCRSPIADVRRFIHAPLSGMYNPFLLRDMDRAVDRILLAMKRKEKICVYGDYDVDGAISVTLLMTFFREIEYPLSYYIPHRLREGYSLNEKALKKLQEDGVNLLITVDNGIMAFSGVELACELGIDVIVTDHHQTAEYLPKAWAVVNPQRQDCTYPSKGISGAGVAYKLMAALRSKLRENYYFAQRPEPNLKKYLAWLAVATVCDVVPLTDENRIFVKQGLEILGSDPPLGLAALLQVSGVKRAPNVTDLGFRIGPRLNACGRLEDPSLGVRLLLTDDPVEANELATLLDSLNRERQDIEEIMVAEALDEVKRIGKLAAYVLFKSHWHIGVVGIVASRLIEKTHVPVFVLGEAETGEIKGSGRSVPGVNLIQCLQEQKSFLTKFGGHKMAAGVTLSPSHLEEFRLGFLQSVENQMWGSGTASVDWVDARLDLADIDERLMQELDMLEPFGQGHSRPIFVSESVEVLRKEVVGGKHLRLKLKQDQITKDIIFFRQVEMLDKIPQVIDVSYGLEWNEWRDQRRVQLIGREFYPR